MRTRYTLVLGVIVAVIGLILGRSLATHPYTYYGDVINPPTAVKSFSLTDQNGQTFQFQPQNGKITLIFFGYTHCTDVCPLTLAHFKQVKDSLGAKAGQVQFIFVTIDPERDTPEAIHQFVNHFDPSFIGLTGTDAQLEPVYKAFWVSHSIPPHPADATNYTVNHSSYAYLIDQQGQIRLIYNPDSQPSGMAKDILHLLGQGG